MSPFHLLQGIGGQWRHLCALDLSQRAQVVDARKTQMIAAADVSWDVSQNFRWKPLKTTQSCCNNLLLRDANKDFHLFEMGFGCWHADSSQSSWRMPEFRSVGIVETLDDIRTRSLIAIRLLWCSWCHSMAFQYIYIYTTKSIVSVFTHCILQDLQHLLLLVGLSTTAPVDKRQLVHVCDMKIYQVYMLVKKCRYKHRLYNMTCPSRMPCKHLITNVHKH